VKVLLTAESVEVSHSLNEGAAFLFAAAQFGHKAAASSHPRTPGSCSRVNRAAELPMAEAKGDHR